MPNVIKDTLSMPPGGFGTVLSYTHEGVALELRYRMLEHGLTIRSQPESFDHPAPMFCRLFLFIKNGANIRHSDGSEERLRRGVFYLLPAGMPFAVRYDACHLLYFHIHFADYAGLDVFAPEDGILQLEDKGLCQLFSRFHKSGREFELMSAASFVMDRFATSRLDAISERCRLSARYGELIEFIRRQPPAHLSVNELARRMHLSRSALSKGFSKRLGMPLKSYLSKVHEDRAKELLLYTDMTVSEVAYALGYKDPAYFHRVFKKQSGYTPDCFRAVSRQSD